MPKDFNIQHPTELWITKWCNKCKANTWHEWNEVVDKNELYTCKKCKTTRGRNIIKSMRINNA